MREAQSEEALTKLRAAQIQIESYEEQLRGRLGLPGSIKVADVLKMKKALGEAQMRILELEISELERDERAFQTSTAGTSDPQNVDADHVSGNRDEDGYGEPEPEPEREINDDDLYCVSDDDGEVTNEEAKDDEQPNSNNFSFF